MGGGAEFVGVEAVKLLKRLCVVAVTACLPGACVALDWHSGKGAEENWAGAYLSRDAQFTLRDGSVKKLSVPQDFGPAVCAFLSECIDKSEIVSARWYRQSDASRAGEYTGQLAVAAVFFPYTALVLLDAATRQPMEQPARPPDWSYIPDNCSLPNSDKPVVIQDAQAAGEWIKEHRWLLGPFCLKDLARLEGGPLSNAMLVELDVLGSIRQQWTYARCALAKWSTYRGVVTHLNDPTDARRGPPGYFDLVTRLLLDERTWAYEVNLTEYCANQGGVAPEAEWPERKLWMRALHPFPPAGFEETFP